MQERWEGGCRERDLILCSVQGVQGEKNKIKNKRLGLLSPGF